MNTNLPVSRFAADPAKCVACGACVVDCPAHIIQLEEGVATITPENDANCIGCQHCLAVCPTEAISVVGKNPADSQPVEKSDIVALDRLIRGRRSVRQFTIGGVDREVLQRVLDTVAYAPTGVNMRKLRFTFVIEDKAMEALRRRTCEALVAGAERISAENQWIVDLAREWLGGGEDGVFRGAPHLVVVTAGPEQVCKVADCLIALSYFDLVATANGIGTTWCGMFEAVLQLFPESREWLGIPADHTVGYAMLFGPNGVRYPRTAQHEPQEVVFVDELKG